MLLRSLMLVLLILVPGGQRLAGEPEVAEDDLGNVLMESLGIDLPTLDRLQRILDDGPESAAARARETYQGSQDVLQVDFAHAGEDRYLWRVTCAEPPRLADTVLHLYVDADDDAATGRRGPAGSSVGGTDFMLSVVADRGTASAFSAEGRQTSGPAVRHLVRGNTVLISADLPLGRDALGVRYGLYVLCHTTTTAERPSPRMSDSSAKVRVANVPVSDQPKRMRPADYLENHGVSATFGEDLLHAVLAAPGTIVVPHDQLETEGFAIDLQTTHRWPHLKLVDRQGVAWTTAPRAGRYHVGFLMYDDSNDERLGLSIDGKFCGAAVARQNNNRTWLYWLTEPHAFRGGERVELRTLGGRGKFGVANLVFLSEPPEERAVRAAVENVTVVAPVGRPGVAVVSWTTTWPGPTRLVYGREDARSQVTPRPADVRPEQTPHVASSLRDGIAGVSERHGDVSVLDEASCLVHRVVLEDLDPAATYRGQAIATGPDGSTVAGEAFTFRAVPPPAPATGADTFAVPLAVQNPHEFAAARWPITTGVPFAQGALASADQVRLMHAGEEHAAQFQLTARWPDGSVKWLLVTFLASVPAGGQTEYRLECGPAVQAAAATEGLTVQPTPDGVRINSGVLTLHVDRRGSLRDVFSGDERRFAAPTRAHTVAEDLQGTTYLPAEGTLEIEEAGPIRAVIKSVCPLRDARGSHLARIEQRIEAYAGLAWIRVHHTLVVDGPERFTTFQRLSYRVPLAGGRWTAPLTDGQAVHLAADAPALYQMFDDAVAADAGGGSSRPGRIVGQLVHADPHRGAVAVRDCWQNYPKAFRLADDAVEIDLCPAFPEGTYDGFPFEKEGHHLYFYLLGGRYRLKQGMAKTHELLLSLAPPEDQAAICGLFQRPLLATAPAEVYCRSRAFYDVAPRNEQRFPLYEQAIDRNLKAYVQARQRQRDYGLINYGDWYGERGTNWGNVEYDTQHALLLEYIRSGNPEAFFLAHATELHNRDVDTVHAAADPRQCGAVHIHVIGHVGDYFDQAVPGALGFVRGGFSVSHAWTEGHFGHYFLTGDRRSYETGCAVADYFARRDLARPYDFFDCRVPGWYLIMMASAYHATGDPYYLNAARVVVERVLEAQDKAPRPLPAEQAAGRQPFQQGGWSRMMVPGHCQCEPRHRGNAGFMVAVLLSGLKYYHDVTGDERVKQSIIDGANYLLDETYSDEVQGFRYTSCPRTDYRPGASPLMVEGLARAYLWTRDERFRRVLAEALPRGSAGGSYGKSFSMYYRVGPRVLADLEAAGLELTAGP